MSDLSYPDGSTVQQQQQQQQQYQNLPSHSSQPQQQQQQQRARGPRSNAGAHANAPSKVLHIRGLPPYTSENDLLSFFSSLPGVILTRILILPNANQAFIQLNTIEAANALLQQQQAMGGSFVLKGSKSIILQYSNRQEIHTPTSAASASQSASSSVSLPSQGVGMVGTGAMGGGGGGGGHDSQQQANSILIVTVLNTRVPVTLDHIHSICKPYGDVLKIITFHKNGVFKALVQFGSIESAVNARMMLEGKDIFQGCCHLRIGFSSLQELHVKSPGNNARDFTTPTGATPSFAPGEGGYGGGGNGPYQQAGLIHQSGYNSQQPYQDQNYHAQQGHTGGGGSSSHPHSPGCVVLVSNLPETRVTCDVLFTLFGVYGDVQRVKVLYQKRDTALIQYVSPQSAYLAALHLNHLQLYGKQISVTPSKHIEVSMPKTITNGGTQQEHDQQLSGLTQDYTHSPIHRFKRTSGAASAPGANGGLAIHAKSIHPPSQVLHVSSLADAVTEDELRSLFSTLSVPGGSTSGSEHEEKLSQSPPIVQFFTSTPKAVGGQQQQQGKPSKQAFLRFESVAAAVENLIEFQSVCEGRVCAASHSALCSCF
jgi:hnRNP-L/PTB/hephaestus splicing factor